MILNDIPNFSQIWLSFGAISAWKSAAATADDDYNDDRKSGPHMSPSYAGDTTNYVTIIL